MVEPWAFIGSYWWLIFPFLGVMGGVARAWERGARGRHARRLEILHAKAEIKAAQAAARGKGVAAAPAVAAVESAAADETQETQLERLFAAHDAVTKRWLDYELDVAKLIAFPAMSDGRQPLTAAFLRAKKVADGLRPASAKARLTKEQLTDYRNAVTDYEVAFDVAERDARRLKDSTFTEVERRRLDTAKQLLTVAIDQAATPAERQLAYRRVREELDGLISLSDGAIEVLETKVALELPASATAAVPTTPDATTDEPAPAPRTADAPAAASPSTVPPAAPTPTPWPVPARPQTPRESPPSR
jgi:hypothetical protein